MSNIVSRTRKLRDSLMASLDKVSPAVDAVKAMPSQMNISYLAQRVQDVASLLAAHLAATVGSALNPSQDYGLLSSTGAGPFAVNVTNIPPMAHPRLCVVCDQPIILTALTVQGQPETIGAGLSGDSLNPTAGSENQGYPLDGWEGNTGSIQATCTIVGGGACTAFYAYLREG